MQTGSLRHIPANWTEQLDLDVVFGLPRKPLEVDLGAGKGRFLLARAARHPELRFLGLDALLQRVEYVERQARQRGLFNVRLIYVDARYAVNHLIPPLSVSNYYFFFSDPWPKRRQKRKRLFNQDFLNALERTLLPGGRIFVATDFWEYFEQIRAVASADKRFQEGAPYRPCADERTDFELKFMQQNMPIGRCSFIKV